MEMYVKHTVGSIVLVAGACSSRSRVRLCDCSLSGSSVHGILQAGVLEWVAISCSGVAAGFVFVSTPFQKT